MPSLDEAYDRDRLSEREPSRVLAGAGLGLAGALAVVAAIVILAAVGDATPAKARAGALAGLGVPAMLLSVVLVLPATTRERAGVVLGSLATVAGVWLFWHAYPAQWTRTADSLAFETVMLYGLGGGVALWYVFTALATFRRRNTPQGTVEVEVVRDGGTRTVEVSPDRYREMVGDGGDPGTVIEELEE